MSAIKTPNVAVSIRFRQLQVHGTSFSTFGSAYAPLIPIPAIHSQRSLVCVVPPPRARSTNLSLNIAPQSTSKTTTIKRNQQPLALFSSVLSAAQDSVLASITPQSRCSYSTGQKRWLEFTTAIGTNPSMSIIPAGVSTLLNGLSWHEAVVMGFLSYLHHTEVDSITPNSACTYLSAVIFMLQCMNVDTSFIDSSVPIARCKKGMRLAFRLAGGNEVAKGKKLPFLLDMIHACIQYVLSDSPMDLMIRMAMLLGLLCVFRKGELVIVKTRLPRNPNGSLGDVACQNHHIRTRNISFIFRSTESTYPAHLARDMQLAGLLQMIIEVETMKNDQDGSGNKMCFSRYTVTRDRPYDLVTEVFLFNQRARPEAEHPFLSWQGQFSLKIDKLVEAMRKTAIRAPFHMDPKRFSTKSLRIAGATILAAAGVEEYIIMKSGRWKSVAFMKYMRLSVAMFDTSLSALSNISTLSMVDMRRLLPGAG